MVRNRCWKIDPTVVIKGDAACLWNAQMITSHQLGVVLTNNEGYVSWWGLSALHSLLALLRLEISGREVQMPSFRHEDGQLRFVRLSRINAPYLDGTAPP